MASESATQTVTYMAAPSARKLSGPAWGLSRCGALPNPLVFAMSGAALRWNVKMSPLGALPVTASSRGASRRTSSQSSSNTQIVDEVWPSSTSRVTPRASLSTRASRRSSGPSASAVRWTKPWALSEARRRPALSRRRASSAGAGPAASSPSFRVSRRTESHGHASRVWSSTWSDRATSTSSPPSELPDEARASAVAARAAVAATAAAAVTTPGSPAAATTAATAGMMMGANGAGGGGSRVAATAMAGTATATRAITGTSTAAGTTALMTAGPIAAFTSIAASMAASMDAITNEAGVWVRVCSGIALQSKCSQRSNQNSSFAKARISQNVLSIQMRAYVCMHERTSARAHCAG